MRIPEPLVPVVRLIIDKYNAEVRTTQGKVADELLARLEVLNNG